MICLPCRNRRHQECREGSWCDCQHRPGRATERPAPAPSEPADRPAGESR